MMTETLRFMQVQTPTVDGMVNATEFRQTNGTKRYTVTVINENGHSTIQLPTREDAIDCADNYIAQLVDRLNAVY